MTSEFETIISKEFLTHIFSREVESFTSNIATKPGENWLSSLHRVTITFENDKTGGETKDNPKTKSILVKCYPVDEPTRKFLDNGLMFPTEYFIYDQFFPILNNLAKEITCDNLRNEAFINVAGFYGGNIPGKEEMSSFDKEPWTKVQFLILEDLRERNFVMLKTRKELELEHCLLVINQLANIHALSWVYKQRSGIKRLVDKYEYFYDDQFKKNDADRWSSHFKKVTRQALSFIGEEFGSESDIFLKFKSFLSLNVVEAFMNFLSPSGIDEAKAEKLLGIKPDTPISEPNEPWLVATHGDCYKSNLLFNFANNGVGEDTGKPTKVVLIDYQTFRETCLSIDLAYFIYSSMDPCVRKDTANVLLDTYFEKFTKVINAVGGKPPVEFTYETFQRRMRRARVFALLMLIHETASGPSSTLDEFKKNDEEKFPQPENIENVLLPTPREVYNYQKDNIFVQTVLQEYYDGIL